MPTTLLEPDRKLFDAFGQVTIMMSGDYHAFRAAIECAEQTRNGRFVVVAVASDDQNGGFWRFSDCPADGLTTFSHGCCRDAAGVDDHQVRSNLLASGRANGGQAPLGQEFGDGQAIVLVDFTSERCY